MLKRICTTIGTAAAAALMLPSAIAMAQASSFEQIARQALATHPAILSKQSNSLAAKAELDGASWQRYPTPSLEFGTDQNGTNTTLLRVQQPLWAGGRITAGIDLAQWRHLASESAIKETKLDVVLRVVSAFVEAQRQQARIETIGKGIEQHERLLGLITRRVQNEASPRVDQELAQSRLYQASNDLSNVAQALSNALTQLSQLAGKPIGKLAALEADGVPVPKSKESALEQAIAASPTLRRLGMEEEAAQAEVVLKRASYKPQISVRWENAYASAPLNGIPSYSTSRVLLVAEMQTGAGLSALSGVEAAIARRDAARQQRETALRDLKERVSMDWDELAAARKRLENARLASSSSKEVYESYTRQYTAGRKTWLDVLNTVRESTQSEVAVTDSSAQVTGAALRLGLVTGNFTGLSE
ncbi:MAG: TolC family protein [Betaproteobacteria bacterium]|nr:TolC family protein [Betaproteobacteria bacterium]